jgi:predicted GNAT family N-acyltransferase
MIGTLRMMPLGHGLTLTEELLQGAQADFATRWPRAWDAGRLVLASQYRVGQEVVRRCLWLALEHMLEHTDVEHLVGSCTHALSRLYRRFGFEVVARDVALAGAQKSYSLIHGTVPAVYAGLAPAAALEPA